MQQQRTLKIYGLTGLAYFGVWLAIDLSGRTGPWLQVLCNSIWLAVYITILNAVFFEFTLPRLTKRWLTYPLAILVVLFLSSFGLFAFRYLGIVIHIYTPLRSLSIAKGVLYIAPHGLLSLLFFGIVKNQYDHMRTKKALEQLKIETNKMPDGHLIVTIQKKKVRIPYAAILYIESQREYIKIVTDSGQYLVKMSTREIGALLPSSKFKRVHRSFIIALDKITAYTAEKIEVGGLPVPVGRAYRAELLPTLSKK